MFGDLALDHAALLAIDRDFLAVAAASAFASSPKFNGTALGNARAITEILLVNAGGGVMIVDHPEPEPITHAKPETGPR